MTVKVYEGILNSYFSHESGFGCVLVEHTTRKCNNTTLPTPEVNKERRQLYSHKGECD
jgi:hypothetical protein